MPSVPEWIVIGLVVLLLFGARKIPDVMRGFGQGIREFKKASHEAVNEINTAVADKPADAQATAPPVATSAAPEPPKTDQTQV